MRHNVTPMDIVYGFRPISIQMPNMDEQTTIGFN